MGTDSTPIDDPDFPSRHSLGPAIAAVPSPTPLRPAAERSSGPADRANGSEAGAWFAVVLRGYDRAQVDARLAELDRRIRDEILRADAAESALTAARNHVRRLQDTAAAPAANDERGFGVRVERVLAAAEKEASDLRTHASQEAEGLLEKAREDAERARRRTEQALLGRASKLDDEFAARSAALDTREQEVDRIVEHARREADEIRAEAGRAAAEAVATAERSAADLRRTAEGSIEQQRAEATRDIGRMATLRDEVRHELSRLQEMLAGELGPVAPEVGHPAAGSDDAGDPSLETGALALTEDTGRDVDGTVPPFAVASIGVLPFGDRSAGGPANGRSYSFELVPDMRTDTDDGDGGTGGPGGSGDPARTSENDTDGDSGTDRNPTRSTLPSRGRR